MQNMCYNIIMEINYKQLIKASFDAQKNSYAPYSKFCVGASLLCKSGKIYTGANIENASYPAGICAERSAFCEAICDGEKQFEALCITCSNPDTYAYPCGVCRQFISEFSTSIKIIVAKSQSDYKEFTLNDLLPHNFNSDSL